MPLIKGGAVLTGAYGLSWWTKHGKRLVWCFVPFSKGLNGWERLDTPRRCIYYRPGEANRNRRVQELFKTRGEIPYVSQKLSLVLAKGADHPQMFHRKKRWARLFQETRFYEIYRRQPLIAGGWAQTKAPPDNTVFILGLEGAYCLLGPWTTQAVGHELVHVAQEIREGTLSREWDDPGPSLLEELLIEGEAHICFKLWMISAGLAAGVLIILCVCWQTLWG